MTPQGIRHDSLGELERGVERLARIANREPWRSPLHRACHYWINKTYDEMQRRERRTAPLSGSTRDYGDESEI